MKLEIKGASEKALLELLSSSIKVKNDRDLYRRLFSYFKSFSEVKEFGLAKREKNSLTLIEGSLDINEEIQNKILSFKLPKLFIDSLLTVVVENDEVVAATPVYEEEGEETWCLCRLEKESLELVFNRYFFRHLENVLIFRKRVSKSSAYLDLANTDEVTGLYNQRKLAEDLERAIESHSAANKTFALMFIDVDHFKKVNDNYGHVVGSRMLTEIGAELQDILRSSDKIYRYGGDEFVVVMPEVDISTVHKIAARVGEKMKEKRFQAGDEENYRLSLSIGIAEYPTDAKTAKEIVEFADSMMYVSKKSGRGKVFHVGEVHNDTTGAK